MKTLIKQHPQKPNICISRL